MRVREVQIQKKWWGAFLAADGLHVILGETSDPRAAIQWAWRHRRRVRVAGPVPKAVAIAGRTVREACDQFGARSAEIHNPCERAEERRRRLPLVVRANRCGGRWYTAIQVGGQRIVMLDRAASSKRVAICRANRLTEFWTGTRNNRKHGFGFLFIPQQHEPARIIVVQADSVKAARARILEIIGVAGTVMAEAVCFLSVGMRVDQSRHSARKRTAAKVMEEKRRGLAAAKAFVRVLGRRLAKGHLAYVARCAGPATPRTVASTRRSLLYLVRFGVSWICPQPDIGYHVA